MIGELRNRHGERIDATFAAGGAPLCVIGHGVTGNKDRPWAVTLADALGAAGLATLRITFTGNGDSDGDFRDATITKEVDDLGSVLDACEAAGFAPVCYVGHSMGAAVGVLRASRDARIARLVSLGGMVDTAGFYERKFGALTPGRDVMWEKPECPLSQAWADDMRSIGSVADRGAEVGVPWLLVHGTADEVVPLADSRLIAARGPRAELVELDGADHVFTGEGADRMAAIVTAWLHGG